MPHVASLVPLLGSAGGYTLLVLAVLLSAAGVPLPISAILLAVGVDSVHENGLLLVSLCASCTIAAVAGDSLDFLLGRAGAPALVSRCLPWLARLGHRLQRLTGGGPGTSPGEQSRQWTRDARRRSATLALFTSRFLPPLMPFATPISLALGASRFAFLPFLLWDLLGEAIFVVGNVALGRVLSGPLAAFATNSPLLWLILAAVGIVPALLAMVWPRRRLSRSDEDAPLDAQDRLLELASA